MGSEILEQVGQQKKKNRRTKLKLVNMPSAVIYFITMWADTTILKEKTELAVWVLKVFMPS